MKAEEYTVEKRSIGDRQVQITSCRIGERYFCHVDNIDPGATIARAEAATLEEAQREALEKAGARLKNHRAT